MTGASQPGSPLVVVAAELVFGLLCGVALAALLVVGGGWLAGQLLPDLGMGLLVVMLYLAILGFAAGCTMGVALAGRWQRQGGSWWLAFGGSLLGGVAAYVLAGYARITAFSVTMLGVVGVITLGCAVLGYNLRRAPRGAGG